LRRIDSLISASLLITANSPAKYAGDLRDLL
jgi:hypothetical protein